MNIASAALAALVLLALPAASADAAADIPLRLSVNGRELSATLEDSPAARDFCAMLPLRLKISDFNGTEKISDLPGRLSERNAPESVTPGRATSPTMPPGAISPCSTGTFAGRGG